MHKALVLIAEDDDGFRTTLVSSLQLEGYDVVGVRSGEEALQRIRSGERRPDLIVLDLNMSVLNGWDFLAVRQRDPVLLLIPVIVMSAESEIPPEINSELFLRKPFALARLRETVARVLEWVVFGGGTIPQTQ